MRLAVLDAALEQHLHADADAEHRPAAGEPLADHVVAADRAQAGHARGERADPGNDQPVGLRGRVRSAVTSTSARRAPARARRERRLPEP